MKLAGFIAVLFVCLVPCAVRGASGDWNVYLNPSAVNRISIVGDSLWCATKGGILLFDLTDSSFTHYFDGFGFRSSDVSVVTIDGNGSIWLGFTSSGITRIDGIDTEPFVKHYSEALEGISSDSITSFAITGDDVYYGCANGVAKIYQNVPLDEFVLTDSLDGTWVNDLLIVGDTLLWAACDEGVAFFNRNRAEFHRYAIGGARSLCRHGSYIYSAGEGGIWRFDGNTWSLVVDSLSAIAPIPVAICSGGGELYCATRERAYRWNGNYFASLDAAGMKNLFDREYYIDWNDLTVRTIVADDRGVPWVAGEFIDGARGAYLSHYSGSAWRNRAPELLSQSGIVEIEATPGGVWVSTRYYGISYKSEDDQWIAYTKWRRTEGEDALSYFLNNLVLLYDSQGYLWCGTIGYDLDVIQVNDPLQRGDDQWAHLTPGVDPITTNAFIGGKEDPAGNRWFLSDESNGVINIISADGTDSLAVTVGTGRVVDCAFGSFGKVYLAISGFGVQVWRTWGFNWEELSNTRNDFWPPPLVETTKDLWAVASNDTTTYVGTSSGLIRYREGRVDSISRKLNIGEYGLVGGKVSDIEYDRHGNVWIATDEGINRIASDGEISAFTSAEHWKESPDLKLLYPISVITPLPSAGCNALEYDQRRDILWIGTKNGLVRLDVSSPEKIHVPLSDLVLYPNPVHISRGDAALWISRISDPVTVRVYTVEGELVHEAFNVSDGQQAWDLLSLNGFKAVSGVYVVRISSTGGEEVRKVAVIR